MHSSNTAQNAFRTRRNSVGYWDIRDQEHAYADRFYKRQYRRNERHMVAIKLRRPFAN